MWSSGLVWTGDGPEKEAMEKVLQEKDGLSSRMLLREFVQSSVSALFKAVVNSRSRVSRLPRKINRQTSDIEVIKEKFLGFDHRKRTPTRLPVRDTKYWDIPNLEH